MYKVSVITPVLNSVRYIEDCIQNVIKQTYPDIEHIIVDGGSTDGSLEIINKYCKLYPKRIKMLHSGKNGAGEAINLGITNAKGEICGWHDSDDLYELNAVEIAIKYFEDNPNILFLYGACNQIDLDGKAQLRFPIISFDLRKWIEIWISGKRKPMVLCCAAFFKVELMKKIGEMHSLGGDLDFLVKMSEHTEPFMIPELLGNWRYNPESVSYKNSARAEKFRMDKVSEDLSIAVKFGVISNYEKHIIEFAYRYRKYLGWLYLVIKPIGSCIIRTIVSLRSKLK